MRILAFALAALLICSASAEARQRSGGPPVLEAPKGTAAISGVVVDASTGQPLEGAMVSLGLTTGGAIIQTLPRVITDPKGRFLLRDLAPATKYYIRVARLGYAPARYGSSGPGVPQSRLSDLEIRTSDDIVTISVAADQWLSDLRIPIWRLGTITGRVLDERGEPVVGVAVRGFITTPVAGRQQLVGTDPVTTDDRGVYRLADLMPGKYAVSVLSVQSTVLATTPEAAQRRAVGELSRASGGTNPGMPLIDIDGVHFAALSNFATPPPPSTLSPRVYAAQYYPGTATLANARLIDLDYGTSRRGIDFQLQPAPAVTVSGRVEGGDASGQLLRLMPAGSEQLGVGSEAATTIVERDGSFTFLNVPSGEYTILAQSVFNELIKGNGEWSLPDAPGFSPGVGQVTLSNPTGLSSSAHSGKGNWWGRTSVTVGASRVTDVMVTLRPSVTVRGRVVMTQGGSGLRLSTILGAQPANGDSSLGRFGIFLNVNGETPFALEGLGAGKYLIGTPATFGLVGVASVTVAGREVRDTGIDTTLGQDIDDVVVTLTENVATIEGTVQGSGAPGATIIVFPADRTRWTDYGAEPVLIKSKAADVNGVFAVRGLVEGDYLVIAVDTLQHDAWTDPRFFEAAANMATRVSLKWGDKKPLDITVSKVVIK